MSRSVEITILGQKYVVRSDQDEAQLQEVARFVDARMSELSRGGRATTMSVAVLGALNIANEYFLYRKHVENVMHQMEERSDRLVELLDNRG